MKLAPDDIVLVRVKAFGADHKIADKWKQSPYRILSQLDDQPVFKIQEVGSVGDENIKVLHRNMLYPLLTYEQYCNRQTNTIGKANVLMDLYFS